jgi:hypothetical protein
MGSLGISAIVLCCVFGGALLGMCLRARVPADHLGQDSKDVVKLGMGLIGTMAALVLGLMVGSAKSSYDSQKNALTQMSAKIILLDRALAHYGPESAESRELLRGTVTTMLAQIWSDEAPGSDKLAPKMAGEVLFDKLQGLSPKNDTQRQLQNQALSMVIDIGQTRWLLFQQSGSAISTPLLIVLVFWLSIIFGSFGLLAPVNATTVFTLLLCAIAVSGAIFLIFELDTPFEGLLQIPNTPLRNALVHLGK